jgi:hypothetical protein
MHDSLFMVAIQSKQSHPDPHRASFETWRGQRADKLKAETRKDTGTPLDNLRFANSAHLD